MSFGGVEVAKAVKGPPTGAGVATRDISDIVNALQGVLQRNAKDREGGFGGVPYPRDPRWTGVEFGPQNPLTPESLQPPRPDTGQPDARLWQYPQSWNVQIGQQRHVAWEVLRKASETPLFRACIELRKTELCSQDWQISVDPAVASRIAQQSGENKQQVAARLRKENQGEIDRLTEWWTIPDRKNGHNFSEWIGLACDEQLTHDALAIYPHQTYGGSLCELWVLDGATIMPLLDESGGRPLPPFPAYQQLLYGFPRGEFTAQVFETADGFKYVNGGMTQSQLIYKRRTPRRNTPYGYSPTEQALLDGMLYAKRFGWMVSEYTEGVMPTQFIESDGLLDWTPTQLLDYERQFNDRMAGQTAERMRAPFLPPGLRPSPMQQVGERYRPEYDLHLIKLVAMHYALTATELGFPESGGLGSVGFHEGQEDINFRRARLPDLKWWADLCTEISRTYLDMPAALKFNFLGLDSDDEAAADELDHNRLADGRITLNESRARLSLSALPFREADMPMLQTARGVVFLDGASETAPPGVLIEPASEQNDSQDGESAPNGGRGKPGTQHAKKPIKPVSNVSKAISVGNPAQDAMDAAQAEFNAYCRWIKKPQKRAFEAKYVTEAVAKALDIHDLVDPEWFHFAESDEHSYAA